MEEEIIKRIRVFSIILYKDSTSYDYDETIRYLKSMGQYAYIEHKPEKEEKKVHTHFILHCPNGKEIKVLSNKTGIPINHIKNVRSERSMLRYLIHYDDKDKIQYSLDQVNVSETYKRIFRKAFDDMESEEQQITNIYSFINELVKNSKSRHEVLYLLIQYVNSNCYDTIYKRYRQEFNSYLNDMI